MATQPRRRAPPVRLHPQLQAHLSQNRFMVRVRQMLHRLDAKRRDYTMRRAVIDLRWQAQDAVRRTVERAKLTGSCTIIVDPLPHLRSRVEPHVRWSLPPRAHKPLALLGDGRRAH